MALPTTGLTAHYDASSADDLWKTFVSGGPHTGVPVDGDSIAVWDSEEGVNRIFKQSGANGVPVWRAATPLLPLPCLDFTGGQRLMLTNHAGTNVILSDLITNTACTALIAFYAETITQITGASQPYNGHPLIGDTGGYWGAFLHVTAAIPSVSVYNYDGTADVVTFPVTAGAAHVVLLRHESGTLAASLDGGAESATASGTTQSLTGHVLTGAGTYTSANLDGRIGEIAIYNTALTGTTLTDAVSYFTSKWLVSAPVATASAQSYVWGPL